MPRGQFIHDLWHDRLDKRYNEGRKAEKLHYFSSCKPKVNVLKSKEAFPSYHVGESYVEIQNGPNDHNKYASLTLGHTYIGGPVPSLELQMYYTHPEYVVTRFIFSGIGTAQHEGLMLCPPQNEQEALDTLYEIGKAVKKIKGGEPANMWELRENLRCNANLAQGSFQRLSNTSCPYSPYRR